MQRTSTTIQPVNGSEEYQRLYLAKELVVDSAYPFCVGTDVEVAVAGEALVVARHEHDALLDELVEHANQF